MTEDENKPDPLPERSGHPRSEEVPRSGRSVRQPRSQPRSYVWGFRLVVLVLGIYLSYRLVQGVMWVIGQF